MDKKETIEKVIEDLEFLIEYETRGTGTFDTIQMMKQMITMLESVI